MKIRWTVPALNDFREMTTYIASDSPASADLVAGRIFDALDRLAISPEQGRLNQESGARLLPVPKTSAMLIYEVDGDNIWLHQVRHMARRPFGVAEN